MPSSRGSSLPRDQTRDSHVSCIGSATWEAHRSQRPSTLLSLHFLICKTVEVLGRRLHTKKQRHYFANKGPSSQGYGFSSGHVWM